MYQTCPRVLLESCKSCDFFQIHRESMVVCAYFWFLGKIHIGSEWGSSTTITQAAVGKKKQPFQTRQLKLGYYRNPLSMPGLQPTEPMYSWGYSEGDCYGFSLRILMQEENNRDKAFHLLHTKEKTNQSRGFLTWWRHRGKVRVPSSSASTGMSVLPLSVSFKSSPLLTKREGPLWFRRDVSLS